MRRLCVVLALLNVMAAAVGLAQQASTAGPYKVLKSAKVGGLGGFDYIYADNVGRRLYIPRGAVQGATSTPARVTVFNLDTLAPVGEIPNTRANGAAVDPKSGHGFASSKPVAMWDTKTLTLIKEKGPTSFAVEQNLQTMAGAKCLTLDTKTKHILTMAAEYGPPPAPATPPPAGAPPQGRGGRGPMLPDSFRILVVGK
jgi:hypothetical protein